ncbi:MAG: bifunctional homocysteine S-methyltransferase/methylenetetrahydrofolate reductase [Acidobacteriota bacterium]
MVEHAVQSAGMSSAFLEELDRRVLVCDGAMGTQLYAKGVFINRCFDSLNLTHPELVASVHAEYVRAGADLIETNTFGANRIKLRAFGLSDQVGAINASGARIARRAAELPSSGAARRRVWVAGAMGPLGVRIEPWGRTGVAEAAQHFEEQARALVEGGVDLIVLETFRDLNELCAAIEAVRRVGDLPLVAQMTTEEDGNSLDGTPPEQFAPVLVERGADVLGVNCSVGPAPMLESIERLAAVTTARLSAMPNAGRPRDIEGRNIYLCSPEYMASYARRFIALGVRLVGGCCGTTPEHIRQIRAAVGQTALTPAARIQSRRVVLTEVPHAQPPVPRADKSRLARALGEGHFVVGATLTPPRGGDGREGLDAARALTARPLDFLTVVDGSRSGARMSALALAVLIQRETKAEILLQYSCRDKNLLGIQSDLLGAHALGLRNLLGTTGEVRAEGDIPDATAVFDVDAIGLTNLVTRLNHALDVGGQPLGASAGFFMGVMVNPSARDIEAELRRFEYKVEAGAEFAVTRPLFDVPALERFLTRTASFKIPTIATLWPFDSLLNAEFMANEVPGITVPDPLVQRMRTAGEDGAIQAGLAIVRELGAALRPLVQGLHVSGAAGRPEVTLEALDSLA